MSGGKGRFLLYKCPKWFWEFLTWLRPNRNTSSLQPRLLKIKPVQKPETYIDGLAKEAITETLHRNLHGTFSGAQLSLIFRAGCHLCQSQWVEETSKGGRRGTSFRIHSCYWGHLLCLLKDLEWDCEKKEPSTSYKKEESPPPATAFPKVVGYVKSDQNPHICLVHQHVSMLCWCWPSPSLQQKTGNF